MTRADLQLLAEFNHWASGRILDAVEKLTPEQFTRSMMSSFDSLRDTVAHLYMAEWLWSARLLGLPMQPLPKASEFPDVASLSKAWPPIEARLRGYIDQLTDAEIVRVMEYTSLSFGPAATQIGHIIQHVFNHASYHRGQVTTMLRQLGADPPLGMDFTRFIKERAG